MKSSILPGLALLLALGASCGPSIPRRTVRLVDGRPVAGSYVSPGAYQRYLQATIAEQRGDGEGALALLEGALVFDPSSPYLRFRLAEISARLGRIGRALGELRQALELQPDFPEALVLQSQLLWRRGQRAAAEASLRRCLRANPGATAAHLALAEVLERTSRPAEARRLLESLLRRTPGPEGHDRLAILCLRQLDYACARRHLGQVLEHRSAPETLHRLAHVARAEGRWEESIRLLRETFDRTGGSTPVAAELLEVLRQTGRRQALDDLVGVLEREATSNPERLPELIALLLEAERFDRVLAVVDVGGRTSADPRLQVARAAALAGLGRGAEAKAALRPLLGGEADPAAAQQLARILQREGARREAAELLAQSRQRHTTDDPLVLALSRAWQLAGQDERAVQVVRAALAASPRSRRLRFGLGAALERAGRWREAIPLMEAILKENPEDAPAHNFIGFALAEHGGDMRAAERAIRLALYHQPGEGYIIDSLGWLHFRRGELLRAELLLRMAVRLTPREPEVLGHLAEVRAARQAPVDALRLLRQAIACSEDPRLTARLKQRLAQLESGQVGSR